MKYRIEFNYGGMWRHLTYPTQTNANYIRDYYDDVNEAFSHVQDRKSSLRSNEYKVVEINEKEGQKISQDQGSV